MNTPKFPRRFEGGTDYHTLDTLHLHPGINTIQDGSLVPLTGNPGEIPLIVASISTAHFNNFAKYELNTLGNTWWNSGMQRHIVRDVLLAHDQRDDDKSVYAIIFLNKAPLVMAKLQTDCPVLKMFWEAVDNIL